MADRHRIGTFTSGGRFTTVLDLADGSYYAPERDTFKITPPAQSDLMVNTTRRYGGSRKVGEIHDNGQLSLVLQVQAVSQNSAIQKVDALLALAEDTRTQYFYEWRPDGVTYSVYYELRGTAWDPEYRWIVFSQAAMLKAGLTFNIAPLGLGDPLDIYDDWSVDSSSDYTVDAGGATLAISGGQLVPSSTALKEWRHTARGYQYPDAQATFKFTTGASAAGDVRTHVRASAATQSLYGIVSSSALKIFKRVAGVDTQLATTAATLAANTTYWLRTRVEGNVVITELFTTEPTPSSTPTTSLSYTLSVSEASTFTTGYAVLATTPAATDWRYSQFCVEPYTYRQKSWPDTVNLPSIPGTGPAKADVMVGVTGVAQQVWTLIGWATKPAAHNLVWNGGLEDSTIGTSGWVATAVAGVIAAATSVARDTTAARLKYGSADLQIVTPATTDTGASFAIYRKFRKGVTYTVAAYLSAASATTQVRVKLGVSGDIATSTAAALTTTPTLHTTTWTPTADVDVAYVAIGVNAATGTTFNANAIQVYEGTTAPTVGKQAEGKGAYPPFGVLQAQAAIPQSLSNWTITASGSALGGYHLVGSASTSFSGEWMIDPSLLASDDFSSELTFEVYGVFSSLAFASTSVAAVLSAVPESNQTARVYSEWGSTGKALTLPSSGTAIRTTRLGALTLPVETSNASRWRLKLAVTGAVAAAVNLDYLILVPTRQRAAGPTSKVNDSTYPAFFHVGSGEEVKLIRSDLSGRYRIPPGPYGRDSGLSGQLLELPMPAQGSTTADAQALLKLSNQVPDDSTSSTTSDSPLSPAATVHFAVQPRYLLARGQ